MTVEKALPRGLRNVKTAARGYPVKRDSIDRKRQRVKMRTTEEENRGIRPEWKSDELLSPLLDPTVAAAP